MAQPDKERLSDERITGKCVGWRGTFGWVKPDSPIEHEKAEQRGGRVFVHKLHLEDGAKRLRPGEPVEFIVYADGTGLGAEECRSLGEPEKKPRRAAAEDGEDGAEGEEGAASGRRAKRKLKKRAAAEVVEGKTGVKKKIGKKKGGKGQPIPAWTGVVEGAKKWLGKGKGKGKGKGGKGAVAETALAVHSPGAGKVGGKKGAGKGKKGTARGGAIPAWTGGAIPAWTGGAKGKAKGAAKGATKGKAKGASKGEAQKAKGDTHQDSRQVISKRRVFGVVRRMVGKFGWITPDEAIDHEVAGQHGGDVFVHVNDVNGGEGLSKGDSVDFIPYVDEGGLGAMKVRLREGGLGAAEDGAPGAGTKAKGKGKSGGKGKSKALAAVANGKGGKVLEKGGKSKGKNAGPGVQRTIAKVFDKGAKGASGASAKGKGGGKAGKGGKGARKLPPFWEEHWSEEHNLSYFWNSKTKESLWERPQQ